MSYQTLVSQIGEFVAEQRRLVAEVKQLIADVEDLKQAVAASQAQPCDAKSDEYLHHP